MPTAALILVWAHVAIYGVVHETDEGTAAHLFQLLMVVQVPFALYFTVTWLPEKPGPTLAVLGLQAAIVVAAFAGVYFLEHGY